MSRLLIVSNRLPVKVNRTEQGPQLELSSGGLATGLSSLHEGGEGRWIGWSGDSDLPPGPEREHLEAEFAARRLVTVNLTAEEVERFYERYSNGILWPVFHYQAPPLEIDPRDFEAYEAVNRRFADAVAAVYLEGDHIWVQDYQLLLLPEMLRRRLPGVRIGFFLHIPFPSAEVFMTLPQRDRLLAGMLGADLVGFHTAAYMRAFAAAVLRVLGFTSNVDRIRIGSREVRLGVFPMGVDARAFAAVAAEPSVEQEVRALRGGDETRLLVGVDRLDYTKGIPRRLLAFERLLESHPELHGKIRLVQVAVPSREDVRAYQSFRSQAYELVGRIHGRFATAHWVPIYWIYRHLTREAVVALYRAADVMLVTPIRDGMNLVAKEFVASRTDGDGVLVLSEFAGAASDGIGRSTLGKAVDGNIKVKLLRQSEGLKKMPVSLSYFGSIAVSTLKWQYTDRENYFSSRISYANQLLIARKFSPGISLQLMPTLVHKNLVDSIQDDNDIWAIGAGGRFKVSKRVSINAEYYYVISQQTAQDFTNSFSIGVDLETGGHVFQLYMTNSAGIIEEQFIPQNKKENGPMVTFTSALTSAGPL